MKYKLLDEIVDVHLVADENMIVGEFVLDNEVFNKCRPFYSSESNLEEMTKKMLLKAFYTIIKEKIIKRPFSIEEKAFKDLKLEFNPIKLC